jgi:hypothetical protein
MAYFSEMAAACIIADIQRMDRAESKAPIRGEGIAKSWTHDAGAYARCSYCRRYSDNPKSLTDNWPCVCGKPGGWSGSFQPPTILSMWSDTVPVDASNAE